MGIYTVKPIGTCDQLPLLIHGQTENAPEESYPGAPAPFHNLSSKVRLVQGTTSNPML